MKKYLAFILFLILPLLAQAEDLEYFIFSPVSSNYFNLKVVKELVQEIYPLNDYLSGISLFVESFLGPSKIKIDLWKDETLIANKILEIPTTTKTNVGHKIKMDLGTNFEIKSGDLYRIKISYLSGEELKVFFYDLIELLQHTEIISSVYNAILGFLYIQNEPQNIALKFSLYEKPEVTPPEIYNTQIEIVSPYQVNIYFNSNEPIKYKITYWSYYNQKFSTNFTNDFLICHERINKCKIQIITQPNTTYSFQIGVKDYWGNQNIYEGNFLTPVDPNSPGYSSLATTSITTLKDNVPPEISDVDFKVLNRKRVVVKFKTNEYTWGSLLIYTKTNNLVAEIKSIIFDLSHEIDSKEILFPNQQYYLIIKAEDISRNSSVYRIDFDTFEKKKKTTSDERKDNFLNNQLSSPDSYSLSATSSQTWSVPYQDRETLVQNSKKNFFESSSFKEEEIEIFIDKNKKEIILNFPTETEFIIEIINSQDEIVWQVKTQTKTLPISLKNLPRDKYTLNIYDKSRKLIKTMNFDVKDSSFFYLILPIVLVILALSLIVIYGYWKIKFKK